MIRATIVAAHLRVPTFACLMLRAIAACYFLCSVLLFPSRLVAAAEGAGAAAKAENGRSAGPASGHQPGSMQAASVMPRAGAATALEEPALSGHASRQARGDAERSSPAAKECNVVAAGLSKGGKASMSQANDVVDLT